MPSPPRLMGPNMATAPPPGPVAVPISNASPQLLPAPYLAAPGVIYTTPPPLPGASAPYQVPLGYTSPPPTAPPPTLAQQPVASPQVGGGGGVWRCARSKVGFPEVLALAPFCGKDCAVSFLAPAYLCIVEGFCEPEAFIAKRLLNRKLGDCNLNSKRRLWSNMLYVLCVGSTSLWTSYVQSLVKELSAIKEGQFLNFWLLIHCA